MKSLERVTMALMDIENEMDLISWSRRNRTEEKKIFSLVFRIIGNFAVLYARKSNLDTSVSSLLVFYIFAFFFSCPVKLFVCAKKKKEYGLFFPIIVILFGLDDIRAEGERGRIFFCFSLDIYFFNF